MLVSRRRPGGYLTFVGTLPRRGRAHLSSLDVHRRHGAALLVAWFTVVTCLYLLVQIAVPSSASGSRRRPRLPAFIRRVSVADRIFFVWWSLS